MAKRLVGTVVLLMLAGIPSAAQEFPPGYVDPAPLLAAVAEEIGEADLRCIAFSGSGGYAGAVGQTFENAVNIDWPRIDTLANYTRVINWEAGTSVETFDRQPGLAPASWKYGLGWRGGTPTQKETRQTHVTNGEFSWHMDGDGTPVAVPPEIAEVYQLDMWLNPHGFLKAARLPGANPVAFWRWEQIEKGRDGNVVAPEKMHVVAITMFGKYPGGRHDQPAEPDPAAQDDGQHPRAGRLQHRARIDQPRLVRQHQVADQLALAPGLGRQLAVLPQEHRPQRLRRHVCGYPTQRVRRSGAGAGLGRGSGVAHGGDGRRAGRRGVSPGRRPRQQLHDRVQRLRGRLRGPRERGAEPEGHRRDHEAGPGQADPLGSHIPPALRVTSAGCAPTCTSGRPSSPTT